MAKTMAARTIRDPNTAGITKLESNGQILVRGIPSGQAEAAKLACFAPEPNAALLDSGIVGHYVLGYGDLYQQRIARWADITHYHLAMLRFRSDSRSGWYSKCSSRGYFLDS